MSNELRHAVITIELDVWHPFKLPTEAEIDHLICSIKEKALLSHAGNVKLRITWES